MFTNQFTQTAAYRRDRLRPFLGKIIPVVGRFYNAEKGGWTASGYKTGWCSFSGIHLLASDFEGRVFLTSHLNFTFERLANAGVHPGALVKGKPYIIAGQVCEYPLDNMRCGMQVVDLPGDLLPVSELGANNAKYFRLAKLSSSSLLSKKAC